MDKPLRLSTFQPFIKSITKFILTPFIFKITVHKYMCFRKGSSFTAHGVEHVEMYFSGPHRTANLSFKFEIRLEQFQHKRQMTLKVS
jgi:hypothetical protein